MPEQVAGSTPDPIARFIEARTRFIAAGQLRESTAMVLATADARGRPSARVVLLRDVGPRGFVFFTNYESRKAAELDANPHAALCFHWDAQDEQVRVEGTVERTSRAESEQYFARRPRASQVGAWASRQSRPLAVRDELLAEVARVEARYEGQDVPCPPYWGGYRLVPMAIEFWSARDARLHERERYVRADGGWRVGRLQP